MIHYFGFDSEIVSVQAAEIDQGFELEQDRLAGVEGLELAFLVDFAVQELAEVVDLAEDLG